MQHLLFETFSQLDIEALDWPLKTTLEYEDGFVKEDEEGKEWVSDKISFPVEISKDEGIKILEKYYDFNIFKNKVIDFSEPEGEERTLQLQAKNFKELLDIVKPNDIFQFLEDDVYFINNLKDYYEDDARSFADSNAEWDNDLRPNWIIDLEDWINNPNYH